MIKLATSLFNLKIDFNKSKGSYIFDKITQKYYLDFMGMYSSLPLGYNHDIFDEEFKEEISRCSHVKVVNCEMISDEFIDFYNSFKKFTSLNKYKNYHFTCTGALANEAAIKTAMWYKDLPVQGNILSVLNSFHGINSVGNFLTTRFGPIEDRQGNIYSKYYNDNNRLTLQDIYDTITRKLVSNIQGVIIEPIQSTYGDNYLDINLIKEIYTICKLKNIPIIFDEVQTGFCSSGKKWYFQHIDIEPDIVVFGKKSQVSGIMVKDSISTVFDNPKRLSVTFDGDLLDMIRCKYIIKAINANNLCDNASAMGSLFVNELSNIPGILNIRNCGLIIAFDLKSKEQRDKFFMNLFKNENMLCNPTGDKSIRIRPNLAVTKHEIYDSISKVSNCI